MTEYLISLLVGILIGLLGSGGSIVAIPAFMYLANYTTARATGVALVLVTISATIAVVGYSKKSQILYKDTSLFAISGILSAYLGTYVNSKLSDQVLLWVFAFVLVIASIAMPLSKKIQNKKDPTDDENKQNMKDFSNVIIMLILVVGLVFGFLTGLIGVGGGFLIIPLLVVVLRYKFSFAVGTSVVIILINALSSIVFRIFVSNIEILNLIPLAVLAAMGAFLGIYLNGKLNKEVLQRAFSILVIAITIFTLVDALYFH